MNCLYFNTEFLYRERNSPVRYRESAVIHRIAHSLLRGLSALALSGCVVFMGEIAVSWSLDAALRSNPPLIFPPSSGPAGAGRSEQDAASGSAPEKLRLGLECTGLYGRF